MMFGGVWEKLYICKKNQNLYGGREMNQEVTTYKNAVDIIKTAILQSQALAAKAVNQEQLALYFGIGRYISMNTRNKNWGTGAIETISRQLRQELPGLRGFGSSSLKNMRLFYEAWYMIEPNSPIAIGELSGEIPIRTANSKWHTLLN
jgi:hypothetical protein